MIIKQVGWTESTDTGLEDPSSGHDVTAPPPSVSTAIDKTEVIRCYDWICQVGWNNRGHNLIKPGAGGPQLAILTWASDVSARIIRGANHEVIWGASTYLSQLHVQKLEQYNQITLFSTITSSPPFKHTLSRLLNYQTTKPNLPP